ncbi:MAG: glycine--tRNA ligase subunit beta [Desulfatirhabdiaceae bacterium]
MDNLLIEIGTEEIPAGYIEPALNALSASLAQKLKDARISCGPATCYGSPRRLAVLVTNVAPHQEALETEILGPSAKVGFDQQGKPTVAANKFAEKVNLSLDRITVRQTPKGDYLCARVSEPAEKTLTVLQHLLPDVILSTPFPKSMKWGSLHIHFARPIHSVLALLGEQIIPFMIGDIQSDRYVAGHRFMNPGLIEIRNPSEYAIKLRGANVLADMDVRKEKVIEEINRLALDQNGKVVPDSDLVNIVTNLVEYPVGVTGRFDSVFLELPDEVLITSMREHQKYFAITHKDNRLMPAFIAVNNTRARDLDVVARGHERVLRARLNDARSFSRAALENPLSGYVEKLKGVLFQAKLGTLYDKTIRIQKLANQLCRIAGLSPEVADAASRAAFLCKADLVTQLVVEFPKLQGVMGKVYAQKSGESPDVALAIEEHYRPTFSGGPLAVSLIGAIVGIADKIDSICGCFQVGLIPTGASDPYALRRQSIGVIQSMLQHNLMFSVRQAIHEGLFLYGIPTSHAAQSETAVYDFFLNRISNLMADQGFSRDAVAAVTSVSIDHVPHLWARVKAMEALKSEADFEPLAVAFKRVVNIIKKADIPEYTALNPQLFEHDAESRLYQAFQEANGRVTSRIETGDFSQALQEMASLRNPVDAFFDAVLVMAEDAAVRNNRLALLSQIANMFSSVADFSKLS